MMWKLGYHQYMLAMDSDEECYKECKITTIYQLAIMDCASARMINDILTFLNVAERTVLHGQ